MRSHWRFVVFFSLALLSAWPAPAMSSPSAANDDLVLVARRAVELTNVERVKAGLLPLKWNDSLAAAASDYAKEMAANNFFAHNSPRGTTPVDRARAAGYDAYGWGGLYVGENLARGFPAAEGAMQGWMGSEGHRNNLLNPKYREIGVGVATAPDGAKVWAQEFGSRPKVLPIFINGDARVTDSTSVTLTVTSEQVSSWGSVGTPAGMMVSNDHNFAGAAWEPYSSTKAWTLRSNPGPVRVYVKIRDANGTIVESSSDIQLVGHQALGVSSREPAVPFVAQSAQRSAEFRLGFKLLSDQIGDVVGEPREDEHWGPNGDSVQQTTKGMMVWRKADNATAFTNGDRTWIKGPFGVQLRGNDKRFDWEK